MLGLCADLLDLELSVSSCKFLLHSCECRPVDDGRMIVFYVEFLPFAVVDLDLFGYTVLDVGLIDNGIACVFFIRQYGLDR